MRRTLSPRLVLLLHFWISSKRERDIQAWTSHREWNLTMVKLHPVNQEDCAHFLLHHLHHHHRPHSGMVKVMEVWLWATAPAPSV